MTEGGNSQINPPKKPAMTPKAIIHQRFGDKASYKVEEVQAPIENGCPGLAIKQRAPPCLYRCTLQLPETTVVSDTFKKKKDAEQSAAEKAIEKLGIRLKEYNPTVQEAWDDLASRVAYLFANEVCGFGVYNFLASTSFHYVLLFFLCCIFVTLVVSSLSLFFPIFFPLPLATMKFLSSTHPIRGHFRAAWTREGHFNACVPVSVIAVYDPKICTICKYINPAAEANFVLVMSLILKAASTLTDLLLTSNEQLSIKRRNPYPSEIISPINHESNLPESIPVDVVCIPVSRDKAVESLTLNIRATGYYLDIIAHALGLTGASDVLISRTIGKASSEMRMYSSAPKKHLFDNLSDLQVNQASHFEGPLNIRASYLSGQEVYGDAIMASVGYTWRSSEFFHEAVSLSLYYRLLVSKIPSGAYQISRDAILAAKLPSTYTTKSNWRGSFPRDILCTFCRSHHLSEPVFSTQSISPDSSLDLPGSRKKLKATQLTEEEKSKVGPFSCEVKIYSKNQDLILQCSPQESHRKQTDAVQSVALKVLSMLDVYFKKPDISLEKLNLLAGKDSIHFTPNFFNEFSLCHSVHSFSSIEGEPLFINIGGQTSEGTPSNGSLASISYTVSLFKEGDCFKENLESCEEFEFEMGNESVWPHLEAAVAQMAVGQSAYFTVELPISDFILAGVAGNSAAILSLSSSKRCKVEYCVTLLQVTEPMEERMEQAQFSPPLSKQRVEFAVQRIKESSAASLVDFGCGSGSLLDSLLSYPTSLEKIIGVDISQRALAKAAKLLHSKLNKLSDSNDPSSKIKSAVLYDGSITSFDSRLRDVDIGTCLEVIEHMEEEDASLFGDVVLSSFTPKILVVSTPNYEYNVILQGCTPTDDPDEKYQGQACKFRNHDHKFEWTRSQFEHWASELATRHNYSVEFSGVGGAVDVEPGFASQIAIFRRGKDGNLTNMELVDSQYALVWEWSRENVLQKE